jgi:hypothetical protein
MEKSPGEQVERLASKGQGVLESAYADGG